MSSFLSESSTEPATASEAIDPRQRTDLETQRGKSGTLTPDYYNLYWKGPNIQGNIPYYYIKQISGTSMASPQVAGVLACALEIYPDMTQTQAKNYIMGTAKRDQIKELNEHMAFDYSTKDVTDLGGGPNLYLYYKKERPVNGVAYPKLDVREKPASGTVYPRRRKIK
jgi:subtilisin family serine protease